MSAWPEFTASTPSSAPVRADRASMSALILAHHARREPGTRPSREARIAQAVLDQLPERERDAIDMWITNIDEQRILDVTGIGPDHLARVRRDLLVDVAQRLATRAANAPRRRGRGCMWDDDDDAF